MAVGVIDLMLENSRGEAVDLDIDSFAFMIDGVEAQRLVARHFAAEEGKTWTALDLDEQDRYFDRAKTAFE